MGETWGAVLAPIGAQGKERTMIGFECRIRLAETAALVIDVDGTPVKIGTVDRVDRFDGNLFVVGELADGITTNLSRLVPTFEADVFDLEYEVWANLVTAYTNLTITRVVISATQTKRGAATPMWGEARFIGDSEWALSGPDETTTMITYRVAVDSARIVNSMQSEPVTRVVPAPRAGRERGDDHG